MERMSRAPSAFISSGVRVLTVAWLPTGMKTGVGMTPCGVMSSPARAEAVVFIDCKIRVRPLSLLIRVRLLNPSRTGYVPGPSSCVGVSTSFIWTGRPCRIPRRCLRSQHRRRGRSRNVPLMPHNARVTTPAPADASGVIPCRTDRPTHRVLVDAVKSGTVVIARVAVGFKRSFGPTFLVSAIHEGGLE